MRPLPRSLPIDRPAKLGVKRHELQNRRHDILDRERAAKDTGPRPWWIPVNGRAKQHQGNRAMALEQRLQRVGVRGIRRRRAQDAPVNDDRAHRATAQTRPGWTRAPDSDRVPMASYPTSRSAARNIARGHWSAITTRIRGAIGRHVAGPSPTAVVRIVDGREPTPRGRRRGGEKAGGDRTPPGTSRNTGTLCSEEWAGARHRRGPMSSTSMDRREFLQDLAAGGLVLVITATGCRRFSDRYASWSAQPGGTADPASRAIRCPGRVSPDCQRWRRHRHRPPIRDGPGIEDESGDGPRR